MRLLTERPLVTALLALALGAAPSAAQCPDGSAPPCRGGAAAPAPRRVVAPPLSDASWIVVPFDNLAKAEDAEWLRSASVNLLYLDMSRWKDIRVIDDERVADLLRETPEAAGLSALSLSAGLAVARRAGAGRLVMGDVLKLGNRTRVTAKIFNVRTGERLRSVQEETAVQDSVIPLFGKLAQKILNVAPPPGANLGAIGTTRTDAYQEYLAGVAALNRFDLREARRRLAQAVAFDSTFALAHYKQSIVIGWDAPGDSGQLRHAEAAARFQAGLPARERSLIAGAVQQSRNEWNRACETYGALVKSDPNDVEALYGLGDCLYHDNTVYAEGGDTTRMRFAGDWDRSIRAFRRVLDLDPQYHLAYQHIIDALTTERQTRGHCVQGRCRQYFAYNVRVGDSLDAIPFAANDTARTRREYERWLATNSKRRNLEAAKSVAEGWLQSAPTENRAQAAYGSVLVAMGDVDEAEAVLRRIPDSGSLIEEVRKQLHLMDVRYKLGRTAEASRIYDSLRNIGRGVPGNQAIYFGNAVAGYGGPFGRLAELDSVVSVGMRQQNAPPAVAAYQRRMIRVMLGVAPDDSLIAAERALFDVINAGRGARTATRTIWPSLALALRHPRAVWPPLDTAMADVKLRPAIAMMRGDTVALRAAARALDSTVRALVPVIGNDSGFSTTAVEAYLALRDTAAALRTLRFALDTAAALAPYFPLSAQGPTTAIFAPRMMLARADLAAARGLTAEARTWYDRFTGAFDKASPELQPIVERARRARAALSVTP